MLLSIIDNGIGIDEKIRDKVFERFFRVSNYQVEGSGLGLNIVKKIVHLHKAKITLATPKNHSGLIVNVLFSPQYVKLK